MGVRIASHGNHTRVFNAETGDELRGVREVTFVHQEGKESFARIVVAGAELTVEVDDDGVTCETEGERQLGGDRPPVREPRDGGPA